MKINKRFRPLSASLLLVVGLVAAVTAQTPFSKKNQTALKSYEKYIDDNIDIHLKEIQVPLTTIFSYFRIDQSKKM
jgi:hypothetical protein